MLDTMWGYEVDETTIPSLISVAEFNAMTGNRWQGDLSVEPVLAAVSQAIRNYCGWHLSPSLKCVAKCSATGHYIGLPALHVSSITEVSDDGNVITDYEWKTNGSLRSKCFTQKWQGVQVKYTAGLDDTLLKTIVTQVASNNLASPAGVREERAGQVSISYNQSGGIAGGVTLLDRDLLMLEPYRLPAVM